MAQVVQAWQFVTGDAIRGVREIVHHLRTTDATTLWAEIRNFDIRQVDWMEVNLSLILFSVAITSIVTMVVLANVLPDAPPNPIKHNGALGATSQAVTDPNAPPIPPPTEVVSLRIYPIKSCRGIEIDATRLRKAGLALDRNWMFVDKTATPHPQFLTIRSDPSMTLIDTAVIQSDDPAISHFLEVSIHGTDAQIKVPAFPTKQWLEANTTLSTVEIWEEPTDAYEYGPDINKIFSDFFRKDVALVYKGPQARNVNINGREELYGKKVPHHFADVMSLLVASEASLKDLNRRLKDTNDPTVTPLTIERFRPNIIVKGRDDKPWEEDTWKRVRITTTLPSEEALYKIDLDVVARCARCQVPNVDPDTAEKHAKQPWTELMKFRQVSTINEYDTYIVLTVFQTCG